MPFPKLKLFFLLTLFTSITLSSPALAKAVACTGISKKCTKNQTYDKTISNKVYSCYDCKQALCKDGGSGGLAGTKTTSVCTEKATTFQPITQDGQFIGGTRKLAPKTRPPSYLELKPELSTQREVNVPLAIETTKSKPLGTKGRGKGGPYGYGRPYGYTKKQQATKK
jgi:hypothetical protein